MLSGATTLRKETPVLHHSMILLEELNQYRDQLWAMNFDKEAVLVERALSYLEKAMHTEFFIDYTAKDTGSITEI